MPGWCTGMIKKVQTTAERHFARKRTTLAFMRAIMREHRLSGPCCRKRQPFSSPRPFQGRYFSQFRVGVARRERRKGEKGAEKGKDRGARSPRFIAVVSFFYFLFFFPRSTKEYDTKGKGGRVYYTRMNYFTRCFLVEFSFNASENRKRILQKFSRSRSR